MADSKTGVGNIQDDTVAFYNDRNAKSSETNKKYCNDESISNRQGVHSNFVNKINKEILNYIPKFKINTEFYAK